MCLCAFVFTQVCVCVCACAIVHVNICERLFTVVRMRASTCLSPRVYTVWNVGYEEGNAQHEDTEEDDA